MATRCKLTLLATVVSATIMLIPTASDAGWNPLKAVGHWIGQGIASLAGPTLDRASDQFSSAATKAIQDADKTVQARMIQFDEITKDRLDDVDRIMQDNLKKLDESLEQKIGELDVVGTRQIANFEQSSSGIVRYATITLFAAGALLILSNAIFRFGFISGPSGSRLRRAARLAVPLVCLPLAGVAVYVIALKAQPATEERIFVLRKQLFTSYKSSLELGDLDGAIFYAARLNTLVPEKLLGRLLMQLTSVQRDLLTRPALLRTPQGALELYSRSERLEATLMAVEHESSVEDGDEVRFVRSEAFATNAMMGWQIAQTNQDEINATCDALSALENFTGQPDRASPFIWLAYNYIKWSVIRHPDASCSKPFQSEFKIKGRHDHIGRTIQSLDCVVEKTKNGDTMQLAFAGNPCGDRPVETIGGSEWGRINPAVETIVLFNNAALNFYTTAAPAYAALVVTNAALLVLPPTAAPVTALKAEKNLAADQITSSWASFITSVRKRSSLIKGSSMVYVTAGLPVGIVQRALALKDGSTKPKFDTGDCRATYITAPTTVRSFPTDLHRSI